MTAYSFLTIFFLQIYMLLSLKLSGHNWVPLFVSVNERNMEVVNENVALLSNLEVLTLLRDIQAGQGGQQKPGKHQQSLATIVYETVKYLEETPCAHQAPSHVANFMDAVKPFNLTKAEKLQLLNSRPTCQVEIYLMVEEADERLNVEDLMKTVEQQLPGLENAQEDEEVEAEEEEEEAEEAEHGVPMDEGEDYVAIWV